MNNKQVAHTWAQQTGRDARGSNFFSAGRSIFSYGSHFEIARFVERKGARAVLFTLRGYSMSTSRHISYARNALHGLSVPVFHVAHLDESRAADNFKGYRARVDELAASATRARLRADSIMEQAQGVADEANAFAAFFGLRARIKRPELSDELRARVAAQQAKDKAKRAAAEAKAKAIHAENLAAWRRGEFHGSFFGGGIATALRVRGDVIETSRGAEFPVEHGKRAFPLIARVRERGETWRTNGHSIHLGHFRIDEIDAAGNVKAGCHYVEWSEIEACARVLGIQS